MMAAIHYTPPRYRDVDLLFLEWREDVACMVHSMGMAAQLSHVEDAEWRTAFETGATVFDAVLEQADRLS